MKKFNHKLLYILIVLTSIIIYLIHFILFKDSQYILKDFVSQLAFVPIYYFVSTIIIDNILARRQKSEIVKKINMLIGVFFSEIGNSIIRKAHIIDVNFDKFSKALIVGLEWNSSYFANAKEFVNSYEYKIEVTEALLSDLKDFLASKRAFLITMMENQNLLEHDTFTDLILAVFHLCEELQARESFNNLPQNDYNHLSIDMIRIYKLLVFEWLNYLEHIKLEYPHLFSLAVRTNPFLFENCAIIK